MAITLSECREAFDRFRQHFSWILDEYDFEIIDVRTGTMRYCGFMLQSHSCLLYTDYERGHLQFGNIAFAPPSQALNADDLKWYSIADVLDYLRGNHLSWVEVLARNERWSLQPEDQVIGQWATECRAAWPQVMDLFSEAEFITREVELREFVEKKRQNLDTQFRNSVT